MFVWSVRDRRRKLRKIENRRQAGTDSWRLAWTRSSASRRHTHHRPLLRPPAAARATELVRLLAEAACEAVVVLIAAGGSEEGAGLLGSARVGGHACRKHHPHQRHHTLHLPATLPPISPTLTATRHAAMSQSVAAAAAAAAKALAAGWGGWDASKLSNTLQMLFEIAAPCVAGAGGHVAEGGGGLEGEVEGCTVCLCHASRRDALPDHQRRRPLLRLAGAHEHQLQRHIVCLHALLLPHTLRQCSG
eukprot:3401529-Rhodomonas_salina.1